MKKNLCITIAIILAFILGYGLKVFLVHPADVHPADVHPADAPPSGFQSRVIDTIPGQSIVEFLDTTRVTGMDVRRYIQDSRGLRPLTLDDLSTYIAKKHGTNVESRDQAIRDFIAFHNIHETILLTSSQDILGLKDEQLDTDLQALSLARIDDVPDPRDPAV